MLRKLIVGMVLLATSVWAHAQGADVGLVNLVVGDVMFSPQAGSPSKVQAFMRVRDGDRVVVPAGGQVRIVFFEGARQERWSGPASFRAAKTQGEPITGKPTDVQILPASVPQRISRVPELMQNAKLGGIQVRGGLTRQQEASLEQQAALREAKVTYERMRVEMPADDITPELFYYSALYDFLLYDEMKAVVDEMVRKQPANEDVRTLAAWVDSRLKR
jgi:hypothetical protein